MAYYSIFFFLILFAIYSCVILNLYVLGPSHEQIEKLC